MEKTYEFPFAVSAPRGSFSTGLDLARYRGPLNREEKPCLPRQKKMDNIQSGESEVAGAMRGDQMMDTW